MAERSAAADAADPGVPAAGAPGDGAPGAAPATAPPRPGHPPRPGRPDGPRPGVPDRTDRPEQSERSDRWDLPDLSDRPERRRDLPDLSDRPERRRDLVAHGLRCYGLIAAMWIRSTLAYRASFAMTVLGNFLATALDFAVILLMFSQVDTLGGYGLPEVALLYGTSATAFGLADLVMGSTERLGRRVRDGTLDMLLVRPVPVLAQVAADRFALRRLGRVTQGSAVLGYGLAAAPIDWTAQKVLLVPVMLLSGAALFAAVFVASAAFQFVALDAAEVQNSVTYGGTTLLQYPPTLFARDLVRGVTFVVPLAFVNWLPALYVLGRPYPVHLPWWVAWGSPPIALACCALAGTAWRAALRSYRSTGS